MGVLYFPSTPGKHPGQVGTLGQTRVGQCGYPRQEWAGHLTSRPNADNLLTLARVRSKQTHMAAAAVKKDPLHGKGPVFRTLREIMLLPLDQRLDAFVDRLDLLDEDEREKMTLDGKGNSYPACSNAVRLKILDVGKQWLHDAEKQGAPTGKLAALRVFDAAPKKAG